jgi:hypothetical protein
VAEYYIPLSTIVGTLGLERFPVLGDKLVAAFQFLSRRIGVRRWHDSWNDTHAMVRGTAVLATGELTVDLGAFELAFGDPAGGATELEFELASDRSTLLSTAVALGEEVLGASDLDGKLAFAFRADGPPGGFRLVVRDLSLRLRLKREYFRKGEVVLGSDGEPAQIRPMTTGDDAAEIVLAPLTVFIDSERGLELAFDEEQLLTAPPLLIMNDGEPMLGLLVKKLKLDLSSTRGFAEALARGYDEAWRGLFFEELIVFGLDAVHPGLPAKVARTEQPEPGVRVELENWFLGTDGISGSARVELEVAKGVFHGLAFGIELDRGNVIRFGGEFTLRVGTLTSELATLGPDGDLSIGFNVRLKPGGGLLTEFVLRTAGDPDRGLVSLRNEIADLFVVLLGVLGYAAGAPPGVDLAILLLQVAIATPGIDFESITVNSLIIRQRELPLAGRMLRRLDFVLDLRTKIALNLPVGSLIPFLPNIKTRDGHPVGLLFHGLAFSWATNFDDFTDTERAGAQAFELSLDPGSGVSFEVGEETIMEQAPLILTKAGIGRWESGLWFDLGFKMSQSFPSLQFSVLPAAMRLWFLHSGELDNVTFQGASFSFGLPGILFARGAWEAGDVTRASGSAYILGKPGAVAEPDKRSNWLYVVGFAMREQVLPAVPEPVTSRLLSFEFESSSGIPTVVLPGTSLYGISGLSAEHARPALGSSKPSEWLTQRPSAYQVDIDKWEGAADHAGWAAGVVLGASADRARPWNLKAGFMRITPGPVLMLFGTANFLKQRKSVKDTNPAALTFHATLDIPNDEFLLGVRFDKKVPDDTGRLLKLSVPTELFLNAQGWHLYLGKDKPATEMIAAQLLGKFDIAGYLMIDTADIPNLADTGITVPGTAFALGVRFAYEGGRKRSRYKLYYYLRAGADLAIGGGDPSFLMIRAHLAGGLVAKAWGIGFEFEISADFVWIKPAPDHLHGELKIFIDLPWPIPNLKLSIDVSHGSDGDGEPISGRLIDGLTLQSRTSQQVIEVTGELTGVPIDPVFSLAFSYTTRSAASVPGSFNVAAGDPSTFHFVGGEAGAERGYAIALDGVTLFKHQGATRVAVPGPFPALWRPEPQPAAGGLPARRILQLFDHQGIAASRFIGGAAEYVDWATQGFDPCPPTEPPRQVCYVLDDEPLGPIAVPRRVEPLVAGAPVIEISSVNEAEFAESLRRFHGAVRVPAEVVPAAVVGLGATQMIRLPATDGAARPPIAAGERLRIELERAEQVDLLVLRFPTGVVAARGWLGDALVAEDAIGTVSGTIGEDRFSIVRYTLKGPLDRVELEAGHTAGQRPPRSLLVMLCALYSAEVRRWNDDLAIAAGWSQFWSDLLDQQAASSGALLLEPATRYTLEVRTSWAHRRADGSEGSPHAMTDSFTFTTTATPPAQLRGPTAGIDATDWEVRTVPADQARAVYPERPIRLELQDARTDAVFGAFGEQLILRLVDDRGEDLFDRLAFLREHARDLPEYHRAWRQFVVDLRCSGGLNTLDALWTTGVAHFPSVLATGRGYDATLVRVPASVTDLTTVDDWDALPVVYRFGFATSRFASLADHLADHAIFDEVCEAAPDLAALAAALGPGALHSDPQLLDSALYQHLHLLPRDPPAAPELVRLWRNTGGALSVIGLLLDGPEPIVRPGATLAVSGVAGPPLPIVRVDQDGGGRTLVLFRAGATLGPVAAGPLTLAITDPFVGADGLPASETATRGLVIPALPTSVLAEPAP